MLLLPDASRMGYRLRLTGYFLTTMTRRTRCVTVAVGATVRTARQLIHPVREDMLLFPRRKAWTAKQLPRALDPALPLSTAAIVRGCGGR